MSTLFFSYSHKDEALRNELQEHLEMLRRSGAIETWHDRMICAGDELEHVIDENLESADVILLLVSSSFLASNYCYHVEVKRAMERHDSGEARVIPIILRPCDWQQDAPFRKLLAAPTDGRAVTLWPNQDEAFLNVVGQIRQALPTKSAPAEQASTITEARIVHPTPRSSNLGLKKRFTEVDQDRFMDESFEYIAKFFQGSLDELERRYDEIQTAYKRVETDCFTTTIYRNGKAVSGCSICHGNSAFGNGITYSNDNKARGNSFNEMLVIQVGDQSLSLSGSGMASIIRGRDLEGLTQQGAAEHFWAILIDPLQR